jgi:hypothetical protein
MIISIPKRASSFNTYYSDEWSNAMTDEEEMCSECSSGSSWPLSISTDEEHGRVRHEAITLREAVAARKTRIPNPEELSRSDSSITLRIPTKLGKKTEIDTMCECVLLYDSKIVTFSEESELHIKLPRTSLQENPYTPFEETVAQILQVEYNVVLKRSPEKIATYLFTHPYRYNIMNHLYFGIVSHFTQKNVDPVPVLTSIEDSVKHARFQSGTRTLKCYTAAKVALMKSMSMYSSLQVREERLPYSFDPFGCLDLQDD